jgi:predicted transcriptional regulator
VSDLNELLNEHLLEIEMKESTEDKLKKELLSANRDIQTLSKTINVLIAAGILSQEQWDKAASLTVSSGR